MNYLAPTWAMGAMGKGCLFVNLNHYIFITFEPILQFKIFLDRALTIYVQEDFKYLEVSLSLIINSWTTLFVEQLQLYWVGKADTTFSIFLPWPRSKGSVMSHEP